MNYKCNTYLSRNAGYIFFTVTDKRDESFKTTVIRVGRNEGKQTGRLVSWKNFSFNNLWKLVCLHMHLYLDTHIHIFSIWPQETLHDYFFKIPDHYWSIFGISKILTRRHSILIINTAVDPFSYHHLAYGLSFYSCSHTLF